MSINNNNQDIPDVFEINESLLSPTDQENIYTVTASGYNDIVKAYRHFPLPDDMLFPWLHGVDGQVYQQNLFFGVRRCLEPQHRGVMTIHADTQETCHRIVESVLAAEVLVSDQFLNQTRIEKGINLRNFQNQVCRYATLCDLFVYGSQAEEVARALSKAQLDLHKQRLAQIEQAKKNAGARAVVGANKILYKTIIIKDNFAVFERDFPHLVMYDSTGLNTGNYHPFNVIELDEMRAMSAASEVTKNVWAGNTQDAPVTVHEFGNSNDSSEEEDDDDGFNNDENDNPHKFSICIEAHDLADMPLPSTLTLARETLNELGDGKMADEIIHFDMYSTGVPTEKNAFNIFYTRLFQLLQFMEDQSERGRRILIHCSDGYTETSLLVLSWIMYRCKLHLPDAYLYLQKIRSFFVNAADLPTLRQIENKLFIDSEPSPKRRKSELCDDTIKRLNIRSNNPDNENGRLLHDDAYINFVSNGSSNCNEINETIPCNIYKQLYLDPTEEELKRYPWFYSPRFEGSFPSRVLPFLYLGNLNHATNHDMLKALNITHIVSVGENADVDAKGFKLLFLDNLYDDGIDALRGRLDAVMAFVDDARAQGTQCLIHCRVGVSRSAAVTICYIMCHLKFTLTEAYLFVRARRLNVIIQPNLKFMYEMLQLEQRQTGSFSITWPILCKEITSINSSYREA